MGCSWFSHVPSYTRWSLPPSPKCLSSKQWGWKPKVKGEGTARSEEGRRPAGCVVHCPQLCGLLSSLASIHGTRSLSRLLSICPGYSHTWVLLQSIPHQTSLCPDFSWPPKAVSDLPDLMCPELWSKWPHEAENFISVRYQRCFRKQKCPATHY